MSTGENEQALRKIIDMTRLISIVLLCLHGYYFGYDCFVQWKLSHPLIDILLQRLEPSGLFRTFHSSKWLALACLLISLCGVKGKKELSLDYNSVIPLIVLGGILYAGGFLVFSLSIHRQAQVIGYLSITLTGYCFLLSGGTRLSRILKQRLSQNDIFNKDSESFPQEERYLANEYSINLPARYRLNGMERRSWINLINPFRGVIVMGTPGSGKSYFVIRHVIRQHLEKGFAMFVYDFKYDDLTRLTWQHFQHNRDCYPKPPQCYVINFDDLEQTHRCNPLDKDNMLDITDAAEAARTILLGLNREWIKKQGDFFVESPINFLTAVIWFLRKYQDGRYCTLPHAIELIQADYDQLFTVLQSEPEIGVLINPFISAFKHQAMEQLEGQIASAKVAMARLSSPQLYYVLSGHDFTLDINNPKAPKIICMGNNPQKIQIYGAVLSLYVNRLIKLVNQPGKIPCSLVFDEFPTIYLNNMDTLLATARSNKVATCLGIQDFSQLKKDYGKDQADVIMNICGNILSGQVSGESAKQLAERFGRIRQEKQSLSINRNDTSISRSWQLDQAVPASTIATLSAGEMVGFVADNPDQPIVLKGFHAHLVPPAPSIADKDLQPLPKLRTLTPSDIRRQYDQVLDDVRQIITQTL